MTEESVVSLEDYNPEDALEESWSDEIIWTYKVIETAVFPDTTDPLYDFSVSATGEQVELTVIKVFVDSTLNADPAILELDPVVYLVFRSDNNRLTGLVQFSSVSGERVQEALSIEDGNNSTSLLSQSNLSLAPTYLAPFGARWADAVLPTETGNYVYSNSVESGITDVSFSDEMGGELVTARYQEGQPWPIEIVSANLEASLLSEEEVRDIRGSIPMLPNEAEDFDYRAALASSINLNNSIHLDSEWIDELSEDEDKEINVTWEAKEGYRPWAGAWWPLKTGQLIFGYDDDNQTFSQLIRPEIDPMKETMDELSEEIRVLKKEEQTDSTKAEIEEKHKEYTDTQKELVDKLVTFYDAIQSDLDGGNIHVESGRLTKYEDDELTWDYSINELSPMDKMALAEYLTGSDYRNPFYISAWEILNSYNPGGDSWWGHCNGWAAAAILTNEPRESINYSVDEEEIEFTSADLKGLLTESHYSTHSSFYGERYNDEDDDITDLSPENFHKIISFYLDQKGVPFVFDTTATEAVWNFPAWKVDLDVSFITAARASETININTSSLDDMTEYGVEKEYAISIIELREEIGIIESTQDLQAIEDYDEDYDIFFHFENHEITYQIRATTTLTSDAVDPDHIDSNPDNPESMTEVWLYNLHVNDNGLIIGGEWKHPTSPNAYDEDDKEIPHPDFAWVPYNNPTKASNKSSENPFLDYGNIIKFFGTEIERH